MSCENQEARLQAGCLEGVDSTQLPVTASTSKGESEAMRPFNFSREARNLDFYVQPQFLNVA